MKKLRQWLRPLLLSLILLSLLPGSALAREWVDLSQTATLTIRYPVAGVEFHSFKFKQTCHISSVFILPACRQCRYS